jgi:hypothetical protein
MYSSICFGRPHAHHHRLYRPNHDQQHCYHHAPTVKPEAATAVVELLVMDGYTGPTTTNSTAKPEAATAVVEFLVMGGYTGPTTTNSTATTTLQR